MRADSDTADWAVEGHAWEKEWEHQDRTHEMGWGTTNDEKDKYV